MKNVFMFGAVGLLALAVLGVGVSVSPAFAQEAKEEEPCLGVVGETVEDEVQTTNQTLNDPSAAVEEEAQFVEDSIHNPFGLISDEIETTQGDLESVQACFD
jgi:hypothetical protein